MQGTKTFYFNVHYIGTKKKTITMWVYFVFLKIR